MMTNLFSIFDPSSTMGTSLNWSSSLITIMLIPFTYWFIPTRLSMMWNKLSLTLYQEIKILTKNSMGTPLLFMSLFVVILLNNFMGLFPYIFTSTSHMSMTLALSLPLWLSFMLFGWINKTQHMFSHLVPQGTPGVLMPFMVCIETISNLIRPGTLAIRLAANMIAGHLLLTLLGNNGTSLSMYMLNILVISQLMLLMLESAVAIIQSYVFTILITLYSSEVNN
uniref:ATP synthase subunit a n=1 Tax=Myrmecophilus manni TaxID=270849 RepID=B6DE91_9ORTH|nr:ATP synthase F0 subunit 6 [Myrmecophilus manni]ACG59287.1 ATP synthase F0 subunit 6 [Myrmecophilus manni]